MTRPDSVVRRVGQLRTQLEALPDLGPSAGVDALFTELVELCCDTPHGLAESIMTDLDAHAPALRRLCAAGESALERHWAHRIADAVDPHTELTRFPHLGNYRDLVRLELSMVTAMGEHAPTRVAVIGSGPLPLTGLVLARDHGIRVLHVDRDLECVTWGDAVASSLGVSRLVDSACVDLDHHGCATALHAAGIHECDVVILTALTGEDAVAKRAISGRLARVLQRRTLVLARSAVRMRRLLYPQIHAKDLTGLRLELEAHPCTDVVNSILVARPNSCGRDGHVA